MPSFVLFLRAVKKKTVKQKQTLGPFAVVPYHFQRIMSPPTTTTCLTLINVNIDFEESNFFNLQKTRFLSNRNIGKIFNYSADTFSRFLSSCQFLGINF